MHTGFHSNREKTQLTRRLFCSGLRTSSPSHLFCFFQGCWNAEIVLYIVNTSSITTILLIKSETSVQTHFYVTYIRWSDIRPYSVCNLNMTDDLQFFQIKRRIKRKGPLSADLLISLTHLHLSQLRLQDRIKMVLLVLVFHMITVIKSFCYQGKVMKYCSVDIFFLKCRDEIMIFS